MTQELRLGDVSVDLVLKDIKNLHLSVHPPTGRVRIAAPSTMHPDAIRVFAISKLGWIRRQQAKLRQQERESEREFIERESHYVWGRRYLLTLVEMDSAPAVELAHNRMTLRIRPGSGAPFRREVVEGWYRSLIREALVPLIPKWERILEVRVARVAVQRMRTRWGSCTPERQSLRLNTDLAKKPRECLEYILVHEMAHLIEPTHNARFVSLMDRLLPNWRLRRQLLNRLPVRHEEWTY